MACYLMRHSKAYEAFEWHGHDLSRPLTDEGLRRAQLMGESLLQREEKIDTIVASFALRSLQTAQAIHQFFPTAHLIQTELTNPDSLGVEGYHQAFKTFGTSNILYVGHEPDLSSIVYQHTSHFIIFKKPTLVKMNESLTTIITYFSYSEVI